MREVLGESTWEFGHMESINDIWNLISERLCQIITRVVKSCQIRHPEVRIRYPDTSEGSHRIYETYFAWYK